MYSECSSARASSFPSTPFPFDEETESINTVDDDAFEPFISVLVRQLQLKIPKLTIMCPPVSVYLERRNTFPQSPFVVEPRLFLHVLL